jgi:hypothetical protein
MEPIKKLKKLNKFKVHRYTVYRCGSSEYNLINEQTTPRYRFIMELPTSNGITECLVNCERPQTIRRSHNLYGGVGDTTWNPIRVIIRDIIDEDSDDDYPGLNSVGNFIYNWYRSYNDGQYARTYKKNLTIKMVDPTGIIVETWFLMGSYPSIISFNDWFNEVGVSEIEFTLNYDRAIFNT